MTSVLTFEYTSYTAQPKITWDSLVNYIIIYGKNVNETKVDAYYLTNSGSEAMEYPIESIPDIDNFMLLVESTWVYARPLQSGLVTAGQNEQIIYGI